MPKHLYLLHTQINILAEKSIGCLTPIYKSLFSAGRKMKKLNTLLKSEKKLVLIQTPKSKDKFLAFILFWFAIKMAFNSSRFKSTIKLPIKHQEEHAIFSLINRKLISNKFLTSESQPRAKLPIKRFSHSIPKTSELVGFLSNIKE